MSLHVTLQAIQAGGGMRVGGARKAILPPELVRLRCVDAFINNQCIAASLVTLAAGYVGLAE